MQRISNCNAIALFERVFNKNYRIQPLRAYTSVYERIRPNTSVYERIIKNYLNLCEKLHKERELLLLLVGQDPDRNAINFEEFRRMLS